MAFVVNSYPKRGVGMIWRRKILTSYINLKELVGFEDIGVNFPILFFQVVILLTEGNDFK